MFGHFFFVEKPLVLPAVLGVEVSDQGIKPDPDLTKDWGELQLKEAVSSRFGATLSVHKFGRSNHFVCQKFSPNLVGNL